MKITVIGYWGAYPEAEAATSSYLLETGNSRYLIDCGSGTLSRLQLMVKPTDLTAVILSHYHHDHVADIGPLQYAMLVQNMIKQTEYRLPIYGHEEDLEGFKKLNHTATDGVPYSARNGLDLGDIKVDFLKTKHPAPCYAMRLTNGQTNIVYTADTSYFDELIPFCHGADLLISECSLYEGMDGSGPGHMTSEECGRLASSAHVKQLWLSHLPHFGELTNLKEEAAKYFSGEIHLAKEGLDWVGY